MAPDLTARCYQLINRGQGAEAMAQELARNAEDHRRVAATTRDPDVRAKLNAEANAMDERASRIFTGTPSGRRLL